MFGWFKKRANTSKEKIPVFLNPLVVLLAGVERQKGSPLTEAEVLEVRDNAQCAMMTPEQAEKFYGSLDAQILIPRINPENCWEEWQAIRQDIEH